MDTNKFQTTKLWKQTIRKLRLIAALNNGSMAETAERLADEELRRLGQHDSIEQGHPEKKRGA